MGIVLLCALQDGHAGEARRLCRGLIAKPGEAFLPSQHRKDVKDPRRGGTSGQRYPERLGHRAQLEVVLFRECPHGRFGGFRGPICDRLKRNTKPARSEEHTSELQSRSDLVCRLLLEKKKQHQIPHFPAKTKTKTKLKHSTDPTH